MKTRECFSNIQDKVKAWVKGNWGFPFIVGFMVLLFVASIDVLFQGWTSGTADAIANWAYFALVSGVILQLACLSRNKVKKYGATLDGTS